MAQNQTSENTRKVLEEVDNNAWRQIVLSKAELVVANALQQKENVVRELCVLERKLETVQAAHEKKVADLEQSLEHTTQELEQMEVDQAKACDTLTKQLNDARNAHEKAQNAVANLQTTVTKLEEQLADRQVKLDTFNKELEKEVARLNADILASKEARKALDEEVEHLRAQLKDTKTGLENAHKKEVDHLTAELSASEKAQQALDTELEHLRAEHKKAIAGLKEQPKVAQATQTTNVAVSPPAPPPTPPAQAPGDVQPLKVQVHVEPHLEKSAVDDIKQTLATKQNGKGFEEHYGVIVDLSCLECAIITQRKGGPTKWLEAAADHLMRMLKKGNYICTLSSFSSAEPGSLAKILHEQAAQQYEQQLVQDEIDRKAAEARKRLNDKEHKASLESGMEKGVWHYWNSPDGAGYHLDRAYNIRHHDFDYSFEVDANMAGLFAGKEGYNLRKYIASEGVYVHLLDKETNRPKKRMLVYGTEVKRTAAIEAAKELLARVKTYA